VLTLVFDQEPAALPEGGREVCVWRDDAGSSFARALARDGQRWIEWRDLGVFAFSLGSTTVRVRATGGVPTAVVADVFVRVLQPIILQALGRQALHASAVLGTTGVLAFCGVGRSGKSTLAYALGQEGFHQAADDALVIEPAEAAIRAYLLPFVPGLREASRQHFDQRPGLQGLLSPARLTEWAPLRAVFVLRQDASLSQPGRPERVPPVQAFSVIVTHARCFDESDSSHTRRLIDDYLAVAERVPVFSIAYPPRFVQFSRLLSDVKAVARELGVLELTSDRQPAARK
jgi:hypothetical protein